MAFFGSYYGSFYGSFYGGGVSPTPVVRRVMISPYNVPFLLWAHNLTNDFPDDIIPRINSENDWRNWGNIVVGEKSFARVGAPRTDSFNTSLEWASRLYSMLG